MYSVFRTLALAGAIIGLSCGLAAVSNDVAAATTKSHHVKHKRAKKNTGNSQLRTAQMHLSNLGYYKGKVDGLNGPKTIAAIKKFQREHHIRVTGKLTTQTYNAIAAADKMQAMSSLPMPGAPLPAPAPNFFPSHPDFYGHYNQQYENAGMLGMPQTLYSRFAKIELVANNEGATKRYNVMMNGLPLLMMDGQPSIIGVSRTFALGDEDAILLTSYRDDNPTCAFAHHLLVISERGNRTLDVKNCTRGYQAKVSNDMLFIAFPEIEDNRDVGATWRYDHGDLERL